MTLACDSAREELGGIENALLSTRTELARMDSGREEERVTLAERERLLSDLRDEHARRKEEAARREAEWDGLRGQMEQLRRMVLEAEAEIGSLDSEIAALDARIAEADGEAARRGEELSLARAFWEEENTLLAAAREEHRLAQEEVERAKSDLIVRVSQHSDARSGAEALSQRIAEGERSMARLSERVEEALAAVEKASLDLDAATAAEAAAREALEVAERSWENTGEA